MNLLTNIEERAQRLAIKLDFYEEQIQDLRKGLSIPPNEDMYEWVLFNITEFIDQLKILNSVIQCTCQKPECSQFVLTDQIGAYFDAISETFEKIQTNKRQRAQLISVCCKLMLRTYDHFLIKHVAVSQREVYLSFKMFYVFVKEFNLTDLDDENIEE